MSSSSPLARSATKTTAGVNKDEPTDQPAGQPNVPEATPPDAGSGKGVLLRGKAPPSLDKNNETGAGFESQAEVIQDMEDSLGAMKAAMGVVAAKDGKPPG